MALSALLGTELASVRGLFPVTERLAYMDHAGLGTTPTPVREAVRRFDDLQAAAGSSGLKDFLAEREAIRARMAAFVGAGADELAITKNTPEGLSFVASGLDWRPGDNVVLTSLEFPANSLPWIHLERRGVEARVVACPDGRAPVDRLVAAMDERTRVLAISYVQFSTGFRADLAALAEYCRPRGILLVVDAIQAVGALDVDVRKLGIDCMALSSHKWLLSPHGVGWFYCRRELVDRFEPYEVGHGSVLRRTNWLEYDLTFHPDARRFECGVGTVSGLYGLAAALELFDRVGRDRVEARVLALTDLLVEALRARGHAVHSSRRPGEASGIVAFAGPRHTSAEIVERLAQAGVVVSLREGHVRVSPHFYNDEDDILRLVEALPAPHA